MNNKITIFDKGFDRDLLMPDDFYDELSQVGNIFLDSIGGSLLGSGELIGNTSVKDGYLQSSNFVTGTSGWQLTPTSAEINVSTAILSLDIPDTTTANSFHVDSSGNTWWGANVADGYASADAYVLSTGVVKFASGAVGGWTINSTSIYTGTEDHDGYTANAGDLTIYSDGSDASIHARNWYVDTSGVLTCSGATISGSTITTPTITSIQSGSEIAIQGWQTTLVFTASDYRTVGWSVGNDEVITLMDGTVYTFTAGNTSTMAALTYIYLDIATSTTALQVTTTAATAVGTGKILVAIAKNNPDTSANAEIQAFGGSATDTTILVDNVVANLNSTNEFISNTAQIKDAIITNAKITALDVGKLTAGTILSQAIVLGVTAGVGDVYIAGGTYDIDAWTATGGFILGIDDSDSDLAKLYIGSPTKYMKFDGTNLVHTGSKFIELFEAGEDITAENTLCMKPAIVDIAPSADIYTDSSDPDTNRDSSDPMWVGRGGSAIYEVFIKFAMTYVPTNLVKAELIFQSSGAITGTPVFLSSRCTSDFSENGTVTYNNKPTIVSDSGGVRDGIPDVDADDEVVFDVTNLVRNWKSGRYDNYGLKIWNTAYNNFMTWYSKENGTSANRPILRCYDGGDSDGKVYKTDVRDYVLTRNYIGVAQNTDTAGNTIQVQRQGKTTITMNIGENAYLGNAGGITNSTINLDRVLKIGQGSAGNELLMEKDDTGLLIEHRYICVPATFPETVEYVGTPDEAKKAVIYAVIAGGGTLETRLQVVLHRGADSLDGMTRTYSWDRYDTLAAQYMKLDVTWLSSGNELVITSSLNQLAYYDIYFFR